MKRAWEGICNILIRHNSCVMHVTSSEEAVNSEARIPNGRPVIIPNGVDIPEALPPREWLPGGRLRLLYLGRLHPIKGIENLLLALRALQDATISLVICGKGDAKYSLNLRKLANQLGLERSVSFKGPVDGKDKLSAFMQADVCVVPSFTENFGMVVAEALAHGVPVIASRGTPWSELNKRGCGLWADNSPDSLAAAVSAIRVADLMRMGVSGRAWMRDGYDWEAIAVQMLQCYGAIL